MGYKVKLKEYIDEELTKEYIFIISEHFNNKNIDKKQELINKYVLLSDYGDDEYVKQNLANDIVIFLKDDREVKKTISKLKDLQCTEGRATLITTDIRNIVEQYKSKVKYLSVTMKELKFPSKTASKKTLDKKLNPYLENVIDRIKILKRLIQLNELQELIPKENTELLDAIKNTYIEDHNYKSLSLENDLIVFDQRKYIFHKINNIKQLVQEVLNVKFNERCETVFYRGHPKVSYKLVPSVYREQWIKYESNLFRELIIRHPSAFRNQQSTFEKLTKMQHYELPTRLLDITSNPLVALYFACSDGTERTAEICIFCVKNTEIKYYDSDTVSCVSNICRIQDELNMNELPTSIKEFNNNSNIKRLLHEIKDEKPYFTNEIVKKDLQKTIFVKPKLDNERIIRQSGAFILFGIGKDKFTSAKATNIYKKQKYHRYIIDGKNKENILDELSKFGISHSTLFPELDKTSNQLKKEYLKLR